MCMIYLSETRDAPQPQYTAWGPQDAYDSTKYDYISVKIFQIFFSFTYFPNFVLFISIEYLSIRITQGNLELLRLLLVIRRKCHFWNCNFPACNILILFCCFVPCITRLIPSSSWPLSFRKIKNVRLDLLSLLLEHFVLERRAVSGDLYIDFRGLTCNIFLILILFISWGIYMSIYFAGCVSISWYALCI